MTVTVLDTEADGGSVACLAFFHVQSGSGPFGHRRLSNTSFFIGSLQGGRDLSIYVLQQRLFKPSFCFYYNYYILIRHSKVLKYLLFYLYNPSCSIIKPFLTMTLWHVRTNLKMLYVLFVFGNLKRFDLCKLLCSYYIY